MFKDPATLVQLISAVVASVAAVVSIYFSMRTRKDGLIQQRVQVLSLKRRTDMELRKWADAVSERMTEAIFLCDLDPKRLAEGEFFRKRHVLRARLSALIDRGRWFLPNINDDGHGKEKPVAYQGHRQLALNCVVEVFRTVSKLDYTAQSANKVCQPDLIKAKREFVAEIQTIIDPMWHAQETKKLMRE
jgi:hypothetical protein